MLVVDDDDLGESGVVVIEETGVDPDVAGATVSLAIGFKGRGVAECGITAMRVEMMRDLFSLSRYTASSRGSVAGLSAMVALSPCANAMRWPSRSLTITTFTFGLFMGATGSMVPFLRSAICSSACLRPASQMHSLRDPDSAKPAAIHRLRTSIPRPRTSVSRARCQPT